MVMVDADESEMGECEEKWTRGENWEGGREEEEEEEEEEEDCGRGRGRTVTLTFLAGRWGSCGKLKRLAALARGGGVEGGGREKCGRTGEVMCECGGE